MSRMDETEQAIRARIAELVDSGPVPRDDLPAAVAVQPDERSGVGDWTTVVERVARAMVDAGEIARDGDTYVRTEPE